MLITEILDRADRTNKERDKVYGDSTIIHARVLSALFPHGLPCALGNNAIEKDLKAWARIGMLSMIVTKLVRYCVAWSAGKGGHQDSIHDMGVYCFMLEKMDAQKSKEK